MTLNLDENTGTFLMKVLNEKFYNTTDLQDMVMINTIYKQLGHQEEAWLSELLSNGCGMSGR